MVVENVEHLRELELLVAQHGLSEKVVNVECGIVFLHSALILGCFSTQLHR